jgi:hypothetical protein
MWVDALGDGDKADLDLGGNSHAIQVLFPGTGGNLVIHQNDKIDAQWPTPSDDYLAVNKTVVYSAKHNGHQGILIDFSPAAAARLAASAGESDR